MPAVTPSLVLLSEALFPRLIAMTGCVLQRCCLYFLHFAMVEYQYLTQLIRPFILMEFSPRVAVLTGDAVCSQWGRAVCFRCGWSPQTDCVHQVCCVWQAPLTPGSEKRTACNVRGVEDFSEGIIITLQNCRFHAWFPGDTIQLHWHASLSETTGAWF